MMAEIPFLPLGGLHERHPGLTAALAASYYEAAVVCLDRHHRTPTIIVLDSNLSGRVTTTDFALSWSPPNERSRLAWANHDDATRDGAYAVALAAVEADQGLVAIGRAETRTGADYYLGYTMTDGLSFEALLRLEVSGVDRGSRRVVGARVREKASQARRGRSNLPAFVGVVGFRTRLVMLRGVR